MDPLELKLKRALEGQDPPGGFAERVMTRVAQQPAARRAPPSPASWLDWLFGRGWRMAVAGGLAAVVLAGAGLGYRQHQQRLEGEKARAQLLTALQITGHQLTKVRQVLTEQR